MDNDEDIDAFIDDEPDYRSAVSETQKKKG